MSTKLNPTITTKNKAQATADQEGRKRPVVAINEDGKLVVCCRRTAKKNGWEVQDVLYERNKAKPAETPAPVKTTKPRAKKVKETSVDELLGK